MKKKAIKLFLNKKIVSHFDTSIQKGGRAGTLVGGPCPGSAGGPCTSIQIRCTYEPDCPQPITLDPKDCPYDI
jgi:hypothetical protein